MTARRGFAFTPGETKKKQVAGDLRRRIADGEFKVGDSLGDVFKLAAYYGCAFGTVSEAEHLLVAEGLLSPIRPGVPTRVIAVPEPSSAAPVGRLELLARLRKLQRDVDSLIALCEGSPA